MTARGSAEGPTGWLWSYVATHALAPLVWFVAVEGARQRYLGAMRALRRRDETLANLHVPSHRSRPDWALHVARRRG